jgi:hypothetical protein
MFMRLGFRVQTAVNGYQSHGSRSVVEYLAPSRLIGDGCQHAFTAGVTAARRVISFWGLFGTPPIEMDFGLAPCFS